MLSRMLRTAALVYLFIGTGLMMAAEAVAKPSCCCECQSRSAAAEPAPLGTADLAPVAMLDA